MSSPKQLELRARRGWLARLLANYEDGRLRAGDQDVRGASERAVTPERAASIRKEIADIDRELSEGRDEGE